MTLFASYLSEPVVCRRNVVYYDTPLSSGGDRSERAGVLHGGGAQEGPLLLKGGKSVHGQVGAQEDVLH